MFHLSKSGYIRVTQTIRPYRETHTHRYRISNDELFTSSYFYLYGVANSKRHYHIELDNTSL